VKTPKDPNKGNGSSKGAPYEVGYSKPPIDSRFQPGVSGNPVGRKKGSKNKIPGMHEERLQEIFLKEAYRHVKINDGNGKTITVSMAEAVARSIFVNAAKGHSRAQKLATEHLARIEHLRKTAYGEYMRVMMKQKVDGEAELERRKKLNLTDQPDILPHPDHIIINFDKGTVEVVGPRDKAEKARYDVILDLVTQIQDLGARSQTAKGARLAKMLDRIKFLQGLLDKIVDQHAA
jgi:hypothetical protein